ncbi:50S ribosome-binding GTPase [Phytophthora infestans]|uniref:50S ribosome-binding GTPase n=1 Tax=Phytophthora infestans TaxID=4787 RepID=A0A833SLY3_PHYIN|nr:50S ribosome-binding GTPase [Phytophthora infestans]
MLTDMLTRQHTAKKHRGKVLLLGLDGAGKSTLANHLSRISIGQDMALYTSKGLELPSYLYPDPTRALQTASYRVDTSDRYLQLVDLPGRRTCRAKWYNATSDTSSPGGSSNNLNNVTPPTVANFQASLPIVAALFVVDISDATRFPIVATELVRLLKHKSKHKTFTNTQLFLIVNKIDHFLPPYLLKLRKNRKPKSISNLSATTSSNSVQEYVKPVESSGATSSKSKSLFFAAPAAVAGELGPSSNQRRRSSNSTGASSVANSSAASSVFTNAAECCGQDRDSVRALSGWLNEELKKPPPP